MNRAEQLSDVGAPFHEMLTFAALSRFLSIDTDHPEVARYLKNAFSRVAVAAPSDASRSDRGGIYFKGPATRVTLNDQVVEFVNRQVLNTPFRAAFYGSSKLFRLCFQSDPEWLSLYGAALSIDGRSVLIAAHSGTGKTTLTLELIARGAKFFSDEYVFVRRSDRIVAGLPRTLMVRERTLSLLSNAKIRTACAKLSPRGLRHGQRVWDFVDVGAIFGESVFAEPAPLAHAIILERSDVGYVGAERIPMSIAAAEILPRVNEAGSGFSRLAEMMNVLAGVPCHRITAGTPSRTASAILNLVNQ